MKYLIESWREYNEQLSRKEKHKRKMKKLFTGYTDGEDIVPAELKALGRGIITASNDKHDEDGLFAADNTDGSYSDDGKQGERKGKRRIRSNSPCGRRKRPDGSQVKCKDGTLREDDLGLPDGMDAAYIKATVEQAVKKAVRSLLDDINQNTGGCSLNQCLRMYNAVNRSEKGKLFDKPKGSGSKK